MERIYWDEVKVEHGTILIAWTNSGLCYVGSFIETLEHFHKWQKKYIPGVEGVRNKGKSECCNQILQYLNGERSQFTLPLDLKGTVFQISVWQQLLNIPFGETVAYSYIAEKIKNPKAVRAVGRAIGQNPLTIVIPCHRVIGKNGNLTGFRGGLEMKKVLLSLEMSFDL